MIGLFVGQKTVLYTNPHFDADEIWRIIGRERVNVVNITGDAMARPLADQLSEAPDAYDTSSVVAMASSAAIFSPTVKRQLKQMLPNLIITDSLGSSETGFNGTAMYDASDQTKREGAGVRINPGRDTVVLDENLRPVEPGSGVIGKVARGGNIPLGYYKDPEKTAATFIEVAGRRYSMPGDLAQVEADGSITLLGRGSVCINSGGEKIYPEEVEAALKSHADVFDAVVVGIPDERWGEKVAAVIQPRPGKMPALEALKAHCRTQVAGYKVPRALHVVERIQRQPSGKPDYPWAKRVATEALG
jgi:acyl-CoA synthetase (AMP-forming)/AMP-acid ligase II